MRPRAAPGFTLVEMAAALAVTGLVVAAGYAGLSVLSDARAAARGVHSRVVSASNARATLAAWLRSATLLVRADDASAGGHPLNRLVFVTADGGDVWPGPRRIRLGVDVDPTTRPAGLVATMRRPADPGAADTVTLVPEATGLEIRYRFRGAGGWRWRATWPDDEVRVPSAVRLRLVESVRIRLGPRPANDGRPERGLPALHEQPLTVPLPTAHR